VNSAFSRCRITATLSLQTASLVAVALLIASCRNEPRAGEPAATGHVYADSSAKPTAFRVTDAQRARLQVITVALTTFRPLLNATGTVAFNGDHSTSVIAPISGPVVRVLAQLGARVGARQTLATVSSPDFAADVSSYRKAEQQAQNAKRILDRNEQLFADDALSRSELDQSRTDAAAAVADRDAAAQQLRAIGIDEATITAIHEGRAVAMIEGAIRAPISGVVVEKLIAPGQLLQAGTTAAFTIADLSTMWVLASVYGDDIGAVKKGDTVDIVTDASATAVTGRVDFIAPIVDPGTRATTVRVLASNSAQLLRRDQFVKVRFHASASRSGIVAPATAVLRDDDNLPFVFLANSDGTFARRRVTLGLALESGYEITAGLAAGDKLLTNGALFVQFAEHQ
jgi:membrane fusion protein, heavy metal efflux system